MIGADDRGRYGLALAELLEGEHATGAKVDLERAGAAGLHQELERAAFGAEPSAGAATERKRQPVLGDDALAVAPRQVEQRRLLGVEPGAGKRLDLALGDRRQRRLQPRGPFKRQGRDALRHAPR